MWDLMKWVLPKAGLMTFAEGEGGGAGSGGGAEGGQGEGEGEKGASGGEGQDAAPDWRASLDANIKDHTCLRDFKTANEAIKALVNVQPLIGVDKIPVPHNFDNPEVKAKFANTIFDRLGRPKEAKEYKLSPVKMPEGVTFNLAPETMDALKTEAHKLGLLPHQLDGLYKWYVDDSVKKLVTHEQGQTKSRQETEAKLRQDWGQAYDGKVKRAQDLLNKFGGDDFKALLDTGFGNNPTVIRFMDKMADVMSEDTFTKGMGEATMTPAEAQKELNTVRKQLVAMDKSDPEYKDLDKRRRELMEMATPNEKEGV